tara:strand:+ start:3280 stop:3864 length:585 start_codon:yes stop_codon:yes gene_type:complete
MKYSTRDAVSGIQGQMNDNARNRVIESVLRGIAAGGAQAIKGGQDQKQLGQMQDYLGSQSSSYDSVINDSGSSKAEKLFANMKKNQLGFMKSGLNVSNMKDVYTQLMKVDNTMFNYHAGIEKANIQASAYGAKNAAKAEEDADFRKTVLGLQDQNMGGFAQLGQGLDNIGGAIGKLNPFGRRQTPGMSSSDITF